MSNSQCTNQPCINSNTPSYMLYAMQGPYHGFYNNCPPATSSTPQPCDLIYTQAPPSVQKKCWTMCCGMNGCNKQCQMNCVVNMQKFNNMPNNTSNNTSNNSAAPAHSSTHGPAALGPTASGRHITSK